MESNGREYLGTTIAYPIVIANGKAVLVSGVDAVRQSVLDILQTQIGEVAFNREYGSEVTRLLFEQTDEILIGSLEVYITDALRIWERRVNFVRTLINIDTDNGLIHITCQYYLLNQNELESTTFTYNRNANT